MLLRKDYNEFVDWWGLGVLMYNMLCGQVSGFSLFGQPPNLKNTYNSTFQLPFTGRSTKDVENAILYKKAKFPNYITNEARDLMTKVTLLFTCRNGILYFRHLPDFRFLMRILYFSQLLRKDPSQRPSVEQIKGHLFFRKINWDKLRSLEMVPPHIPPRQEIQCEVEKLIKKARRVRSVMQSDCGTTSVHWGDIEHPIDDLDKAFSGFQFPLPNVLQSLEIVQKDLASLDGPVLQPKVSASDMLASGNTSELSGTSNHLPSD
jgi:serine/threonine protein kinase